MLQVRDCSGDCHRDAGQKEVVELKAADCSALAFPRSPEGTRTWLWRYGLLVYRCLRTQMSAWSSMPIRQPLLLQLLTTGSVPTSPSCNSGQHFSAASPCQETGFFREAFLMKGATFPLEQMDAFEGRLSQHLVTACDLSESSVIWRGQRKTFGDKVWTISSTEVSIFRANPLKSWR